MEVQNINKNANLEFNNRRDNIGRRFGDIMKMIYYAFWAQVLTKETQSVCYWP